MSGARLRGSCTYVRRVKGNRYQARPYCSIERERYNLGTFATREQAEAAVREFWRTSRGERPKFVRRRTLRDGTIVYGVVVFHAGTTVRVGGSYKTERAAARAVKRYVTANFPPDVAERLLSRRENSSAAAGGAREAADRSRVVRRRQLVARLAAEGRPVGAIAEEVGALVRVVRQDLRRVGLGHLVPAPEVRRRARADTAEVITSGRHCSESSPTWPWPRPVPPASR